MSRVKGFGSFATPAGAVIFASGGLTGAAGFAAGLVAIGGVGFPEVVSPGIVPVEIVPADIVPDDRFSRVDGFPAVRDLAEEEGGDDVAAETGSATAAEDCC
jgi:hypothetical protein